MKQCESNQAMLISGTVLEVSRRFVTLLVEENRIVTGTVSSKTIEVVAGDEVSFEERGGKVFVTQVVPPRRSLFRSSYGTVKRMGANIDRLLVITACGATFNPVVIDRMLVAAQVQAISATLIVNKIDLGLGDIEPVLEVYQKVGVSVLCISAKHGDGVSQIRAMLNDADIRIVALCGVSGVGKSTILNQLVPGAKTRIGALSERTGQGKQTTSQPRGFLYEEGGQEPKIIIDMPGVQLFGLSHVSTEDAACAFPEIVAAAVGCQFSNCKHLKEPICGVRDALAHGDIASWRYESYRQILQEIEDAREY